MNQSLNNRPIKSLLGIVPLFTVLFAIVFVASPARGQNAGQPISKIPSLEDRKDPESNSIEEMTRKQQISRLKKEYDEMLKNGEEALRLSKELETSLEGKEAFSDQDFQKLQALEKVVSKIREDLGGKDIEKEEQISADSGENSARQSFTAAFKFLRTSTIKLVDELKKSTRFSISVAAIEASNAVIKFARFLRLKK
jgi:hypothetical protein